MQRPWKGEEARLQLLPLHVAGQVPAGRLGGVAQLTHQTRDLSRPPPCARPHVVQQPPQVLPGTALLPVFRLALLAPRQQLRPLTQQVPAAGSPSGQLSRCAGEKYQELTIVDMLCLAVEQRWILTELMSNGGIPCEAKELDVCVAFETRQ